ncbi:tyrosine-type recombinase/integrase [Pseudoalteromonas sp. SG44-1]|uniref:tyrosine-type recombinase/integrase n=1 Tax=unclassified Pseudoalteromonas TaxID=194690 RepID=UPI001603FB1B|nr:MULTISPECIES: tyrosine-type recombinase/integrase [unclassified Pseudoalteromonas]MBB1418136.1 tyrosine-type recombinase/integrase [Pseudoalteromonas sp. SG44-1]MBB1480247.1 tyrosine-type recombinase/integrase [Pseudoalteromonas sp. SG41-2]
MDQFSSYIVANESVDLSKSLLNEDEGVWLSVNKLHSGVVALDEKMRVLPLISEFLSYSFRNNKISRHTAKTYAKNLSYFLAYLKNRKEFQKTHLDEAFLTVSKFVIEEYLAELRTKYDLSTATVRNRDATLQAFIHKFLYQNQELRNAYIEKSPYSSGLISGPVKQKLVISCSLDELTKLMLQSGSERERLIIQFIFDSGVRRSELLNITKQDIEDAIEFNSQKLIHQNTDMPVISPYAPLSIQGVKGRHNNTKQRMTLVSRAVLNRIMRYHASPLYKKHSRKYSSLSETPAFFNAEGRPITPKCLSKLLDRLSERALKKGMLSKPMSPHKLRHGYAYDLLQSPDIGQTYVDRLAVVQKSLGHAFLSSTEVYTKIPSELYKTITNSDGELLTKADRMERLVKSTQLKISLKDKK